MATGQVRRRSVSLHPPGDDQQQYLRLAALGIPRPLHRSPDRPGADEGSQAIDRLAVRRALAALPARQRTVLVLRYYCDLSEAEIAAEMGCRPGTVKSQAARGLATLRVRLGDSDNATWTAPAEEVTQ
ncbi:MAG TPA: sigma-70 family RNA polymerase sigma factor [Mycobacteriales bacterium]|jgi:RNA polymerase sigma factor (sigma-70 family)|nr:sigma-70 family RNA polymerase sigma factor [Mycobacteriales bacterium]HET7406687.1 sigma-70 family RNA polymerase sigma factor [Mycobacteriales bacterium]